MRHKGGDIIETYYLIDYENVHDDGLSGCEKLNNTDYIHVFYTENAKRINMDIFNNHGEAKFEMHKVPAGDQSLDMHLSSFLGYIIGINEGKDCRYVIVSNDTDYDNVIKFWKVEGAAKVSKQPTVKETTTKQLTSMKASSVKSSAKVKVTDKIKLNSEVQQALSKAHYDDKVIGNVAKIVGTYFGKENFLSDVHNALRKKYIDSDYLEVYETIKNVIVKYAPSVKKTSGQKKAAINSEIQQLLGKAGMDQEVINYVASVVVKNIGVKNSKQQIYRTIITKYGQKRGLNIYQHIKKHIP